MKTTLSFWVAVLGFTLPTFAADFVKFNETYTDKLVRTKEDGVTSFDTIAIDSGSFSCSVYVEGLSSAVFDSSTRFSVSLGGYSFEDIADDADRATANSITFFQTEENPDTGKIKKVGQMTFSRKGNRMTVQGTSKALESSVAAEDFAGSTGPLAGQVDFSVDVGGYGASATLTVKGTGKVTTRKAGGDSFELSSVRLTGSGVPTASAGRCASSGPSIAFASPKAGDTVAAGVVTVSVQTADEGELASVAVWANGGERVAAVQNGSTWNANVTLFPGPNLIQAQATDLTGTAARVIRAKVLAPE